MPRLFISLSLIFILFSCSHHLTVSQINTKNIQVDSRTASVDSLVQSVVKPFRDSIETDMSKLVAYTATSLVKGKPESNLTNLVADILLESGTDYCAKQRPTIKPDASYVNYGGLRASIPKGEITVGNIFELMPFENEIVLIKISGESFFKMTERIAARGGEGVSGLKMGIKNEKPGTCEIGGKDIVPNAMYWLVTNDYIANGGDQMNMLLNPAERIDTKLKIRDILIQTIRTRYKESGVLEINVDGRIYNEQ